MYLEDKRKLAEYWMKRSQIGIINKKPSIMSYQTINKSECPHTGEIKITSEPEEKASCEVCGFAENLRFCTSCGSVFCCESYKAHNRQHFQKTNHPIIKPISGDSRLGEWIWCWICNAYLV